MPTPSEKPTRAAVVIGVDRTGNLAALSGAAKGAKQVGQWLRDDGYAVTELTDADGDEVTFNAVFKAVRSYVDRGGLDSLVIYFAGHGYFSVGTEIWLLSGAPDNGSEAIHLEQSKIAASYGSGLRNIVFIADTCRSIPQTVEANSVRGGSIFAMRTLPVETMVDTFYATLPGDVAVEVAEDAARRNYNGLFTTILTELHGAAPADQIVTVDQDGTSVTVVPNRRLRKLLPIAFAERVEKLRAMISQTPALKIESDEPFYLVRATPAAQSPAITERGGGVARIDQKAFSGSGAKHSGLMAAARSLIDKGTIPEAPMLVSPADNRKELQLAREARDHRAAQPQGGFETQCGILVAGSSIVEAVPIGGIFVEYDDAEQPGKRVRIQSAPGDNAPNDRFGSILVRFAEGTGTILAAIPGYLASLVVRDGGVEGVGYAPAPGSPHWQDYQFVKEMAEERRAIAATTARHGILAMDRNEARKFADLVRVGKSHDPTLGIYAALAYASVGLRGEALSVLRYLQGDLRANLLDVWLFAGADPLEQAKYPLLPACPMLSQAWDYCAPLGFTLPDVLATAARRQTLWTTFTKEAMDAITVATNRGELG